MVRLKAKQAVSKMFIAQFQFQYGSIKRFRVIPVEDTVRIRTGERGDIALYNAEKEK